MLLVTVLSYIFTATRDTLLADAYGAMRWVLADIDYGIYYGVPLGAPRPMGILFMNPDGTLDEEDSIVDRINIVPEGGSYEELMATLMQYDGEPTQYKDGDSTYLFRYRALEDGRTIILLVNIDRTMRAMRTFRQNAVVASAVAMGVLMAPSIVFADWVIRPIERAKKKQQDFFAAASHDLRTPLTVILANVGLLNRLECADPAFDQCRDNIQAEAEQMKHMIKTMLDNLSFEAIASSSSRLVKEDIDFGALVLQNVCSFESLFHCSGRELRHDIAENIWIHGNGGDLERVIGILLDNAIKYSDDGSGTFVRLRQLNARTVQLDVHSVSEPMDEQTLSDIFLAFYRADPSRSDRDSYGLGLPTAKNILALHGGKLWATAGDHENVFHISLPGIEPPHV